MHENAVDSEASSENIGAICLFVRVNKGCLNYKMMHKVDLFLRILNEEVVFA
jgi:hypothetical protein